MFEDTSKNGVVDFVDSFNKLKKVRGMLKKRAKKYDSDSEQEEKEEKTKRTEEAKFVKKKKVVQKSTFKEAFSQVMESKASTKRFEEDTPILAKYKKPAAQAEIEKQDVIEL